MLWFNGGYMYKVKFICSCMRTHGTSYIFMYVQTKFYKGIFSVRSNQSYRYKIQQKITFLRETTFQMINTFVWGFFYKNNNKTTRTDIWKSFALVELPTANKFKMILLVNVGDISVVVVPLHGKVYWPQNKTPCISRWLNTDCTE